MIKNFLIRDQISPTFSSDYLILLWHFCVLQSPLILFHHCDCPSHFQIHSSRKVQAQLVAIRTFGIFSSLTKVTTVRSDDVEMSTLLLETEALELFAQLFGKDSSLHVPVFALWYTASGRRYWKC